MNQSSQKVNKFLYHLKTNIYKTWECDAMKTKQRSPERFMKNPDPIYRNSAPKLIYRCGALSLFYDLQSI